MEYIRTMTLEISEFTTPHITGLAFCYITSVNRTIITRVRVRVLVHLKNN